MIFNNSQSEPDLSKNSAGFMAAALLSQILWSFLLWDVLPEYGKCKLSEPHPHALKHLSKIVIDKTKYYPYN